MSSVIAVTENIVFKARIASFYELTSDGRMQLTKEFGEWLKQKGRNNDFLVWSVELITESKNHD